MPASDPSVASRPRRDNYFRADFDRETWEQLAELLAAAGRRWPDAVIDADLRWLAQLVISGEIARRPGRPHLIKRYSVTDAEGRELAAALKALTQSIPSPQSNNSATAQGLSGLHTQPAPRSPAGRTQPGSSPDPAGGVRTTWDPGRSSASAPAQPQPSPSPRASSCARAVDLPLLQDLQKEELQGDAWSSAPAPVAAFGRLLERYGNRAEIKRLVPEGAPTPRAWSVSPADVEWFKAEILANPRWAQLQLDAVIERWDAYLAKLLAGRMDQTRGGAKFPTRWKLALARQLEFAERQQTTAAQAPGRATATGRAPGGIKLNTVR